MRGTLKVAYVSKEGFMPEYGNLLQGRYPELTIEVLEIPSGAYGNRETMREFLDDQKPDLVAVPSYSVYQLLVEEQQLLDLLPLAKRDRVQLDDYHPELLRTWHNESDGTLYGMTPYFSVRGLLYDEELFIRHGITSPPSGATWKDVFQTASRFTDDTVIGLQANGRNTAMDWLSFIGLTEGLALISGDGRRATLDTPGWAPAFQLLIEGYRSGLIGPEATPVKGIGEMGAESGDEEKPSVAMKTGQLNELRQAIDSDRWKSIELPSLTGQQVGAVIDFPVMFGIRSESESSDLAWGAIEYLTSEDWAAVKSVSSPYFSTIVRFMETTAIEDGGGRIRMLNGFGRLPLEIYSTFGAKLEQSITDAAEGRRTVDETMISLQQELQLLLEQ